MCMCVYDCVCVCECVFVYVCELYIIFDSSLYEQEKNMLNYKKVSEYLIRETYYFQNFIKGL